MVSALLLGSALLAAGHERETLAPPDLAAYEKASASVGRDASAHVKLALWCEARGLPAERIKHLAIAVMTDPANATARGLMGLVAYRGRWQRPEAVGETVKSDAALSALLAEYNTRREQTPNTAEDQWRLALWCEEKGLKAEAEAHLLTVVRLDPARDAAWKRLGYKKHEGRWQNAEQISREKDAAEAQRQADRTWKDTLERLRGGLASRQRHLKADEELARITDPRAVPMICRVFGRGNEADQKVAVQLLAQVDGPEASQALAILATFSRYPEARRLASEVLLRRDPREFAQVLVGFLRKPVKYEVRPVAGPGSRGELFVEGERFNVRRLYSTPAAPSIQPGDRIGFDQAGRPIALRTLGTFWTPRMPLRSGLAYASRQAEYQLLSQLGLGPAQTPAFGPLFGFDSYSRGSFIPLIGPTAGSTRASSISFELPVVAEIPFGQMASEAQQAARVAEGQLETDLAAIQRYNAPIAELNERLFPLLVKVSGEDLGDDPESWSKWALDLMGYVHVPQKFSGAPPTMVEQVPIAFNFLAVPYFVVAGPVGARVGHSCFGGGTLVTTLGGRRPIESIRVGDQVLTQDGTTGGLSFQPVVVAYHNPPNGTLRIAFGDETVVVTGIHRFWRAGHGWTMARDLKPGDAVRALGGVVTVTAVERGQDQPVFNLEVAQGASFFVGANGLLVHDNSLVEPVAKPFDATPALEIAVQSSLPLTHD